MVHFGVANLPFLVKKTKIFDLRKQTNNLIFFTSLRGKFCRDILRMHPLMVFETLRFDDFSCCFSKTGLKINNLKISTLCWAALRVDSGLQIWTPHFIA